MQEHTVNTIREIRQLLKELAQMAHGAKNALALYFMKTASHGAQSGKGKPHLGGKNKFIVNWAFKGYSPNLC